MSSIKDSKNFILSGIQKGKFPIGSVMPSVDVLAAQLKCSPGTVHSALKELSNEGIVSRVRKLGTTVIRKQCLCRVCLLLSLDTHSNIILYRAVHDKLAAAGFDVDVVLNSDPHLTLSQCDRLLTSSVPPDFLVALAPQDNDAAFPEIASRFRHCVIFTLGGPAPRSPSHVVTPDQQHSARLVAQHLLSLGHKKILVTAGGKPDEESWAAEAGQFCRHLLEMAGAEYIPLYFFLERRKALQARLQEGVTAFWALNDHHAFEVIKFLRTINLRVPEQIFDYRQTRHTVEHSIRAHADERIVENAPAAASPTIGAQIIEEIATAQAERQRSAGRSFLLN